MGSNQRVIETGDFAPMPKRGKAFAGVGSESDECTAPQKSFCLPKVWVRGKLEGIDHNVGTFMSTVQAIIFGMMLSLTPSVAALAYLLWAAPVDRG